MRILGLQKLTLIDYPGKAACTLFLFGCNFKCGFCHNPELVLASGGDNKSYDSQFGLENNISEIQNNMNSTQDSLQDSNGNLSGANLSPTHPDSESLKLVKTKSLLWDKQESKSSLKEYTQDEILDFLKERKKYLDGVCITGGEPLMSIEKEFLKKIKGLGYNIKIDTNGGFPERLKELIEEGLVDFVAMDVKASKEEYSKVAGVEIDFDKIEESMKIVSSLDNYEFRTTIVPVAQSDENINWMGVDEINRIAKWIVEITGKNEHKYFLQKFVARSADEIVDKRFAKESLSVEMNETSRGLLEEMKGIVGRVLLGCELR